MGAEPDGAIALATPGRDRVPTGDAVPARASVPTPARRRDRIEHPDEIARRALDVGRRTALGVLAGDAATADDVAQEVAILALRHAHRLRDPQALDAWLYRTAVRAALRSVRRGKRRRAVEQDHVVAVARPVADDDVPTAALEDLGRLLQGLPERQRAALTLRYAHDLTDDEIAAALRCRPGTVRALLSRGRDALRARIEAAEDGPSDRPAAHEAQTTRTTNPEGDARA